MTHLTSFPETLLTAPLDTRLHYFQHKVIAHPHLLAAHTALLQHLQYPAGAALIFVYGPTGVGKTTLRQRVEQQLAEQMLPLLHQDPERLPVVSLDVVAPESGNFNWKDYYLRALAVLEMPWWPVTGTPPAAARDTHAAPYTQLQRSHATAEFRRILEQGLRRRRPVAFIHQ